MTATTKLTKNQTRILDALTAAPTALTTKEIGTAVGCTAPTALKNAEKLLKLELVSRGPSRRGAYTFQAGEVEAVATDAEKAATAAKEAGKIECQVCEGHYTKDGNGALWNHGYKRPGWGWLVGGCMGVGYEPFPMTNALERYLTAVTDRQAVVAKRLAAKNTWPTLSYQVRVDPRDCWNKKMKTVTINRPTQADSDALGAARNAMNAADGQDWATVRKPLHKTWVKLHDAWENWKARHRSQVYRLESETKRLTDEVVRVTTRIAKGKSIRATQESLDTLIQADRKAGFDVESPDYLKKIDGFKRVAEGKSLRREN